MISIFSKNYLEKPAVTSLPLDSAIPITKLIIKATTGQKHCKMKPAKFAKQVNKAGLWIFESQ